MFARLAARRVGVLALCLLAFSAGVAPAQTAAPVDVFTFIDNIIVVKPGDNSPAQGVLNIHANTAGKKPSVTVVIQDGGVDVTAHDVSAIGDAKTGDWAIAVTVTNLPANTQLTRHLQVVVDGAVQRRDFTVSNISPGTFGLTIVKIGTPHAWTANDPLALVVSVGPVPATQVVVNAVLANDATTDKFGNADLQLCRLATGSCDEATELDPNQTYKLFLRPRDGKNALPGKYAGTVELDAAEGRSTASQVTITVTNWCIRAWGIALIVLGVALSTFVTIGVRNWLARDQLLLPAAELREVFDAQARTVGQIFVTGQTAQTTAARIADWQARLSDAGLAKYIPGYWSLQPAATSPAYQQFLDKAGAWTVTIATIVDQGLIPLTQLDLAKVPAPGRAAVLAAIQTAWLEIDALAQNPVPAVVDAPAAPPADKLSADISGFFNTAKAAYDGAIAAALGALLIAGLGAAGTPPPPPGTSTLQLRYQIAFLNLATWLVASALTMLVGSYVMVVSHLDFGSTTDLWFCLFWGIGLPYVGSQLTQVTPTSIAGGFGISIIKPSP